MRNLDKSRFLGYTLIEVMIVLTLVGALLALLYQVLQTVWAENFSANTSLQIKQFFQFGRDKSLASGRIISMHIDLEKREMGIRVYDPLFEDEQDSAIYSLAEQNSEISYAAEEILRKVEDVKLQISDETEGEKQEEWFLEPTPLPSGLKRIYSMGGVELVGPKIYVHFYPNGTSDSLLFEFDREKKKYLYLPRYSIPAVYLDNFRIIREYQEEKANP